MKHAPPRLAFLACMAAGLATQGAARAQSPDLKDTSGWFARLGAVARFNVKADIKDITPAKGPGVYDNGFVLPDSGGGVQTWNWGFNEDGQAAGGQLVFDRLDNVPSIGQEDVDVSNPLFGAEIIGGFRFSDLEMGKRTARFGVEIGFGYSGFSENVNSVVSGTASRTTDRFGLGGIVLPVSPYAGTATGPGPLLGLNPNNTATVVDTPGGTTRAFQGSLDANFYSFRIGPTFEIDLTRRLTLAFGAGYLSVYTDGRLEYDEAVTFSDPGLPALAPTHEIVNEGDWRVGAYVEVRLNYRIFRHADVFAGLDFQHASRFTFGDSKYEATLDLSATYAGKAGITFWF